ncbi:MAG: response regulator transcription factor [Acetobacteraceae bacterium]|nr:response regulator transcription factor [Acetobacteraceae bacterium]
MVVDDHDLFRTGIASLLGAYAGIEVVGQASGGRKGVQLASELGPEVVLMDLQMPDVAGPEATRAILEQRPQTRVLALTVFSGEDDVANALKAGATGFLAKDTPIDEIVAAVRAAAGGSAWLSSRAAEIVLGSMRRTDVGEASDSPLVDDLSPRERDVLRLIARGLENSQIGEVLGISPRTVKNHVSSILAKLGLTSRIQAAIYAVRRGLE